MYRNRHFPFHFLYPLVTSGSPAFQEFCSACAIRGLCANVCDLNFRIIRLKNQTLIRYSSCLTQGESPGRLCEKLVASAGREVWNRLYSDKRLEI